MSRPKTDREQLIRAVTLEGRNMGTRTLLFHTVVTDRLGLNASDHKCAEIVYGHPTPMTAGRLAELTGLSTGSITGIVDRLEKAGFVRRAADPDDRRRVVIQPTPDRAPNIAHYFLPLGEAMSEVCSTFTNDELTLIIDFMRKAGAAMEQQTQRVRETPLQPVDSRAQRPDDKSRPGRPRN